MQTLGHPSGEVSTIGLYAMYIAAMHVANGLARLRIAAIPNVQPLAQKSNFP